MLSQYEINKIIEALGHAERNSHASNKQAWKNVADKVREELTPASGGSCSCEDRPCCSCDSDTYLTPYNTEIDLGDVADNWRERMEQDENRPACEMCNTFFDKHDNEDDVVQGFHAECAEDGEH
jgi:hypothetical protein